MDSMELQTLHTQISILSHHNYQALEKPFNLDCSICFENCVSPYRSICGHYHCADCMFKWLEVQDESNRRKTCPTCRHNIGDDFVTLSFEIEILVPTVERREYESRFIQDQMAIGILTHLNNLRNHYSNFSFVKVMCRRPSWVTLSIWNNFTRIVRQGICDLRPSRAAEK